MTGSASEGMSFISTFPEKRWGQKARFCDRPKWFKLFCALQWKVWPVSLVQKQPSAQHTGWDLLFKRTFRGGRYITNPLTMHYFSGKPLKITINFGIKFDSPVKMGVAFHDPCFFSFPNWTLPSVENKTLNALALNHKTSWWLNQPIWKICSSNWIMKPQLSGWKFNKYLKFHHQKKTDLHTDLKIHGSLDHFCPGCDQQLFFQPNHRLFLGHFKKTGLLR